MRQEFDLDPNLIYMNSGTHSIAPRSVLEAVTRYQREYEHNPTLGLIEVYGKLWKRQQRLARFFNAHPEDLFLRANVTQVLNAFILGVPLPRGSEILVPGDEYGAIINQCRFRAERDGLTLRRCSTRELLDSPEKVLRAETKLVLISHVLTTTGEVVPLQKIAKVTRAAGAALVVDGAHAPGAIDVDFSELGDVDYYGGNLHKWMMGPKGTAFGWVNPRRQNELVPTDAGWTTYEAVGIFANAGGGHRFAEKFLMKGCHDFAPFLALDELLDFWEKHTAVAIRARLKALQNHLEDEMEKTMGWTSHSPARGPARGPLLSYVLPRAQDATALMTRLSREHRLQIHASESERGTVLRLSPHIYNTEAELEKCCVLLRRFFE